MQSADFFRADNPEGMEARNEVSFRGHLTISEVDDITLCLFCYWCVIWSFVIVTFQII